MARDLARRAERTSLTLSDLDLRAAVRGQCPGVAGIRRRTLTTMMMQILHHEQMKLDHHCRPDDQPAIQSRSAKTSCQVCSTPSELKNLIPKSYRAFGKKTTLRQLPRLHPRGVWMTGTSSGLY